MRLSGPGLGVPPSPVVNAHKKGPALLVQYSAVLLCGIRFSKRNQLEATVVRSGKAGQLIVRRANKIEPLRL